MIMTTRMIMKTTRILAMTTLRYNNNNNNNDNKMTMATMDPADGNGIMKMMTSRYNDNDENEVYNPFDDVKV